MASTPCVLHTCFYLLDLDGTLISIPSAWARTPPPPAASSNSSSSSRSAPSSLRDNDDDTIALCDGSRVALRPGADAFLHALLERSAGVAFWTASERTRAESIVAALLARQRRLFATPQAPEPFALWARETCDISWTGQRWSTRKQFEHVLGLPEARAKGLTLLNTLHVDDDMSACNDHLANVLPVRSFLSGPAVPPLTLDSPPLACTRTSLPRKDTTLKRLLSRLERAHMPLDGDVRGLGVLSWPTWSFPPAPSSEPSSPAPLLSKKRPAERPLVPLPRTILQTFFAFIASK